MDEQLPQQPIQQTPPYQPPVENPLPPKKHHWLPILGAGLLIGLLVVAGGFYVHNIQKTKTQAPSMTEQTTQVSPTQIVGETANWKTYTNSSVGFSIKYPANWKVTEGKPSDPNPGISFDNTEGSVSIAWQVKTTQPCSGNVESLSITGGTIQMCHFLGTTQQPEQYFSLPDAKHPGVLVALYVQPVKNGSSDSNRAMLLKVFSTFQFTDQTQSSSGLNKYTGKYITFNYPSAWSPKKASEQNGAVLENISLGIPGNVIDQNIGFSSVDYLQKPSDVVSESKIKIGGKDGVKWIQKGQGSSSPYVVYSYVISGLPTGSFGLHVTLAAENKTLENQLDNLIQSLVFIQ